MIFVDSNVPMYLVGSSHPNRERAEQALNRLREEGEQFITSIANSALSYGMDEIRAARSLIESVPGISARDALHAAVMQQAGITRILSYDRGFDAIPSIERLE